MCDRRVTHRVSSSSPLVQVQLELELATYTISLLATMPSLLDHIDRFSHTSEAIRQAAASTFSHRPGPFTKAVLQTPLGDLARDVDPAELGLFTLVTASAAHTHALEKEPTNAEKSTLTRVAFLGATPLRKPHLRKPDDPRQSLDKEPEIYAEAALKYLDK